MVTEGCAFRADGTFKYIRLIHRAHISLGTSGLDRLCYMALSTLPSRKHSFQAVIGNW